MARTFSWFGAIVALLFFIGAQISSTKDRRRVFVVAVRDSSLFTLCPPASSGGSKPRRSTQNTIEVLDGRLSIQNPNGYLSVNIPPHVFPQDFAILDRSRPDWVRLEKTTTGVCPSGWIDPDLKKKAETAFRTTQTDYVIVDSAEDADLIMIVEGFSMESGWIRLKNRGITRTLFAVMAVVVPSSVYRRIPADSAPLLEASVWQALSTWQSDQKPASVEEVVAQFVGKKKPAAGIPKICSAWSVPPPSASGAGNLQAARVLKGQETQTMDAPRTVEDTPADRGIIKINVALVTVPVIASDVDGKFVPDIKPREFHIFENGREQPIDSVIPETNPFHVALLLDTSNSTIFRHEDIETAALAFGEALRADDRIMVLSFGNLIYVDTEFTANPTQIRDAILETRVYGGTRLYDAVDLAVTERLHQVQGRKAMVLLTDGVDSLSRLSNSASTEALIEESNVLVYVIRYNTDYYDAQTDLLGYEYLRSLSENSGGRLLNAATVPSLRQALNEIAEELRHQYTVCYYPTEPANDGSFRRIRVSVDRPDVRVRARSGYRASPIQASGGMRK
jgi:Ca-activated chloride channel family protein